MSALEENRLGSVLLQMGLITQDQLTLALERQRETRQLLGTILVGMGILTDQEIRAALATQLSIPSVDLGRMDLAPGVTSLLPAEFCRMHRVVPVAVDGDTVTLAMANATNVRAVDLTRAALPGRRVHIVAASESDILGAIGRAGPAAVGAEAQRLLDLSELQATLGPRNDPRPSPAELPGLTRLDSVVDSVGRLLEHAQRLRATELIFEPGHGSARVRLVVEGVARDVAEMPFFGHPVFAARLKALAGLDLGLSSGVQEGIVPPDDAPPGLQLQVSTLPTVHGERVAVRLLVPEEAVRSFGRLGLAPEPQARLLTLLSVRTGLIVVAGPSHSGVTTTLHSAALELVSRGLQVVSVEGSAERYLPGVTQVLTAASGEAFAAMVHRVHRLGPEALLVGETPGARVAAEACEAARDALVLLAVAGDDAATGLRRLLDLGLDPWLLSTSFLGALAQRLVRVNCPSCAEAAAVAPAAEDELRKFGQAPAGTPTFKAGAGCYACGQAGFGHSVVLFELAVATPALRTAVAAGPTSSQLRQAARQEGMQPLGEQLLAGVWSGGISPGEALRVGRLERLEPSTA